MARGCLSPCADRARFVCRVAGSNVAYPSVAACQPAAAQSAAAHGAAAFTAPTASKVSKVVVRGENPNEDGKLGAGGMADTRDPEPFVNETDKRQSISQAPSFEEYLKSRQ